MKKLAQVICLVMATIATISLCNCSNNTTTKTVEAMNQTSVNSAKVSGEPCDVRIGGEQPYAYMKISSDTRTMASCYSLDNVN